MAFTNPCGGTQWDMRPDGLIEVEGEGVPTFEPGTKQFDYVAQCWANWSDLLLAAAKKYGLPVSWPLAIMAEETGYWSEKPDEQAGKVSYAGAIGLMQIMPSTARMFGGTADEMYDPASNIDVGCALLADLSNRRNGQLPEMAAAYNSGAVCSPGKNQWNLAMADDYAGNVIRWQNSAVLYLDLSKPRLLLGLTLGAIGLYAGAIIAGFLAVPKPLRRFV